MLTPGDAGTADVRFEVRSDQAVRPISPLIYGTNQPANASTNRYTVIRQGGNRLTAYNWENNASNAGADWYYQNDGLLSSSNTAGEAVRLEIEAAKAIGAAAIVTVPIVDYVAADKNGGGDVRNTPNYLATRFKQNRPNKGSALALSPDQGDAYVNQDEFVNWVKVNQPNVRVLFSLDNEPDLWSATHPEVHPQDVTYVELVQRTTDYGAMVKRVWPAAEVAGFVSYGWNGYTTLQSAPDRTGKGQFVDYFLDQMKAAEVSKGLRVVDYLDLHWYPEAQGGGVRIIGSETTAAVVAARVQAPRSLWDPTYVEASWITNTNGNQAIQLVPWVRAKIAARYPGTKLAITEWNYGAGGHISGGVATADALGVFGREEVALATIWKLNGSEPYTDAAVRAFRNYDGAGAAFGDTSIFASTSDVATATVYGSLDAANPARVVLLAVNRATSSTTAALRLWHSSSYGKLRVWTLTSAGAQLVAAADVQSVGTNAFRLTLPALSVSVLVPGN